MGKRIMIVVVALAAIVAAPILMRRDTALGEAGHTDDRLVIITPHNQTIRAEFGEAFAAWWKQRTGRSVYVDWRTPGGTSEIRRVLDSGFEAAEEGGRAGVGIDVFFGGGDYEFRKQAKLGRLAKLEVFKKYPGWFEPSVIPESFTGERYYDAKEHEWVGVCLSQFGICYNVDGLKRLGLPKPKRWADLADPKYFGQVALADPTKSGSVTRAFEMILQQQMQEAMTDVELTKCEDGPSMETRMERGWERGMRLLQEIGANARYFTDSAVKIPMDVASGDAAAGMCIDFYGRAYNERLKKPDGASRLEWTAPENGTSVSVDPVGVLQGAPHPEIAQAFVEFLLSKPGQFLWNARPGSPGGPRARALRRLPVRKDLYSREYWQYFTDPDALPYLRCGGFVYRGELTGRAFGAIGLIVRAMCIDSHEELKAAWAAANAPDAPPEAKRILGDVSAVSYRRVMDEIVPLMKRHDSLATARFASELGEAFREQYRRVVEMCGKTEANHPTAQGAPPQGAPASRRARTTGVPPVPDGHRMENQMAIFGRADRPGPPLAKEPRRPAGQGPPASRRSLIDCQSESEWPYSVGRTGPVRRRAPENAPLPFARRGGPPRPTEAFHSRTQWKPFRFVKHMSFAKRTFFYSLHPFFSSCFPKKWTASGQIPAPRIPS